jgi:hypothetical protein
MRKPAREAGVRRIELPLPVPAGVELGIVKSFAAQAATGANRLVSAAEFIASPVSYWMLS